MQSSSLKVLASSQKNSASSSRSCSSDDIFPSTARSSDSAFYTYTHARSRSVNNMPHTHTHTRLTTLCPGLPGWAGTRKVKPIWISLKQKTVSGSGISWDICKSAPRSRQITTPAPHHSVFLQAGCPSCRPTNSVKALKACYKHHRHNHHHCRVAVASLHHHVHGRQHARLQRSSAGRVESFRSWSTRWATPLRSGGRLSDVYVDLKSHVCINQHRRQGTITCLPVIDAARVCGAGST